MFSRITELFLFFLVGGESLWDFLDYVVTIRSPLLLMLQPFIQYKVWSSDTDLLWSTC